MSSIRFKIMLVALVSLLAAVATFAAVIVASLHINSRQDEADSLRRSVRAFNEAMHVRERGCEAILRSIAHRADVCQAIMDEDHAGLIDLLTPTFRDLERTFGIVQFYVHRTDGAVLLRVHDPEQRGDSYVGHRRMIVDAAQDQQVVQGIELDGGRMSHRTVLPVDHRGTFAGLLEVGIDYSITLLEEMKDRRGSDSRIWLSLEAAGPTGLWPTSEIQTPLPDLFLYASTFASERLLPASTYQRVLGGGDAAIEFTSINEGFGVTVVPIMGYRDQVIGLLEISQSRAQTVAALRSSLIETILVAALVATGGMALLGLTLSMVVLRPLRGLTDAARKQYEGDLAARAPRYSNDELGMLAETFNGLSNQLTETLQQQQSTIEALGAARRAAEQANSAKDQFLAALSHELRTPLTPVLLTIESLQADDRVPAETKEELHLVARNVQLEARLIDDLLDLTRITQGKLEMHLQLCEIHSLISSSISVCRGDLEQKKIRLTTRFLAEEQWLFADTSRLQQVVWNLLKNAIKFTSPHGSVLVETSNEQIDSRPHVVLRVQDNGIGMSPETQSRLFNPFEQGSRSITRAYGGLGLGLVISKRIVELHGGKIRAHSAGLSQGSTFSVELPVVTAPDRPQAERPEPRRSSKARPLRILLVEDHLPTGQVLARVLRRAGHEVTLVHSISAALSAAAAGAPHDVLISDLGLPDGNGTELMQQLRQSSTIRGIAISGYGMQEDIDRSVASGFDAHLTKPITTDTLLREIARLAETIPQEHPEA